MASLLDRLQTFNIIALAARVSRLEHRMGSLRDYVTAVQTETSRNAESIRRVAEKLSAAINSGDPQALADLGSAVAELTAQSDQLEAMGTGTDTDPLPTPGDGTTDPTAGS